MGGCCYGPGGAGHTGRVLGTASFQAALTDPAVVADPANQGVLSALNGGAVPSLDDSSFLSAIDPRLAEPFLVGFAQSVDLVMLVGGLVMLGGIALTWLMPELPLRSVSRIQGRLDEAEQATRTTTTDRTGPDR